MVTRMTAVLAALVVAGCAVEKKDAEQPKQRVSVIQPGEIADNVVQVWKDPETGCEYLLYFSRGITPRYKFGSGYTAPYVKGCKP